MLIRAINDGKTTATTASVVGNGNVSLCHTDDQGEVKANKNEHLITKKGKVREGERGSWPVV